MRNIVKVVMVLAVIGVFISVAAYAQYNAASESIGHKKAAVIDVGNKVCPVSGKTVDGESSYEYNGKRYGLCCPMCAAAFKAEPEKYSAIADKEVAK